MRQTEPTSAITLIIDGENIHDIFSFFDEINRVFMHSEDWKLGPSLDALNDIQNQRSSFRSG